MIDILRTRRSIRKYKDRAIGREHLEALKEALLRCPSSRGINPWTFIFVDDPETIAALSRSKEHGSQFLKGAPLAVVICGDERESDVWIEDCSITSIVLQLAAHSLGLGSCWVQVRLRPHSKDTTAEAYVQELLGIPPHMRVESIVGIGYPAETKAPVPGDRLDRAKIRSNRF
ncbi:MAG TPA: nitroreductase family protein [Syntrophorhabdaceae bacterium]|nr:nitroreductase family protein [Syntrophorhabdaceae bacterium]